MEIRNQRDATAKLDDDEKNTVVLNDGNLTRGNPSRIVVNLPGLYTLILRSDKPVAKTFRRWVTHEVLPQIRKTGGYIPIKPGEPAKVFMARALKVADATIAEYAQKIEQQQNQIEELKPKAEVYYEVMSRGDSSSITPNNKAHSMFRDSLNEYRLPCSCRVFHVG